MGTEISYTINKLSAIKVRAVTRQGLYGDGGGLWLQVSRSGSKSWIFRYDLAGRRCEMGLGFGITVDLALARYKVCACRLVLLDKRDPLEKRDKARAEHAQPQAKRVSCDECAASYIDAHRGSRRAPSTRRSGRPRSPCMPARSSGRYRRPTWARTWS